MFKCCATGHHHPNYIKSPARPNIGTLRVGWGGWLNFLKGCEEAGHPCGPGRVELETGAFAALTVTGGSSRSGPSSSCDADARKATSFSPKPPTPRSGAAGRAGLAPGGRRGGRRAAPIQRSLACQPQEGAQEPGLGRPGTDVNSRPGFPRLFCESVSVRGSLACWDVNLWRKTAWQRAGQGGPKRKEATSPINNQTAR